MQRRQSISSTSETDDFLYGQLNKPHTISILILLIISLLYVALYTTATYDTILNVKIGLLAVIAVFLIHGLLMYQDGPFIRPHPAFWRIVLASSGLYQLFLTFLLFQNADDSRQFLRFFDPSLGIPLPERSYATNCELTWLNIVNQVDEFVIAHVLGWVAKGVMFRDYWICWVLSIMFEVLEYSLQHQLPNFAECWWDHWILDVLLCNWMGLEIGMFICRWLELKEYSWRGIRQIPTYTGKLKRAVSQFTPYSWTKFDWQATKDFKHFFMVLVLIIIFLQGELNAFYLKYLLWIPAPHIINPLRLLFFFFSGTPAIREAFQYISDPNTHRLGSQAWLTIANIMTETLVIIKFGKNEFDVPTPIHVKIFWLLFTSLLIIFCVWQFMIVPRIDQQVETSPQKPLSPQKLRKSRSKKNL